MDTNETNSKMEATDGNKEQPKTENLIMRNNKIRIKNFLNRKYDELMASKKPKIQEEAAEKINKKKIFIMNIEWSVTEKVLEKFFSKFGQVTKSKIIRNIVTHDITEHPRSSMGYGYIKFESEASIVKVFAAQPEELILKDRQMNIEEFIEKTPSNFDRRNLCDEFGKSMVPDDSLVNTLPTDILMNIFSELCLRDLCMIERGF